MNGVKAPKPQAEELKEIADHIHRHLKRFENSTKINATNPIHNVKPYYGAAAVAHCGYIYIKYILYQSDWKLGRVEAEQYLKWLNEGNIGKHFDALSSGKKP